VDALLCSASGPLSRTRVAGLAASVEEREEGEEKGKGPGRAHAKRKEGNKPMSASIWMSFYFISFYFIYHQV